jgi:hypothetical protein
MTNRKFEVTHNESFGTGESASTLVRLQAITDPGDAEAVAMNAGIKSLVLVLRLAPQVNTSAWVVGQARIIDIGL